MRNGTNSTSLADELDDNYELLEKIGSGSYATVHKAINKETGELCAIKRINAERTDVQDFTNELSIISNSSCDNIVKYLASGCCKNRPFIVMEYCSGGSVRDAMRLLQRPMTYKQICAIVKGALNGLDDLHRRNYIHRDIKAANILLHEDGHVKLVDFGVSELCDKNKRKESITGTPLWLPPEVVNHDPNYGKAIDIWSLGITIIEMADTQPPYADLRQEVAWQKIGDLEKPAPGFRNPSMWPPELNELLSLCLNKNASHRKSANDLLKCEIMQSIPSPSSEIISLVAEISSTSSNQKLSRLQMIYNDLLTEERILFGVCLNRKRKVIQVDFMVQKCFGIKKDFEDLEQTSKEKHARMTAAKEELKALEEDRQNLERVIADLEVRLTDRSKLKKQLETAVLEQSEKRKDEMLDRRRKLNSLREDTRN